MFLTVSTIYSLISHTLGIFSAMINSSYCFHYHFSYASILKVGCDVNNKSFLCCQGEKGARGSPGIEGNIGVGGPLGDIGEKGDQGMRGMDVSLTSV